MDEKEEAAAKAAEEAKAKAAAGATETTTQTPEELEAAKAEEAKKEGAKIPEEEWQKRVEKVKKEAKEEITKELAEKLGMKPEEKSEEDPMEALTSEVEKLKKDNERKTWETKHSWVLHEDNEENWNKVNEEPRYATLTYEERMIQAGITETSTEEPDSKSVPAFNKVIPPKGTMKQVEEWRKSRNKDVWKM